MQIKTLALACGIAVAPSSDERVIALPLHGHDLEGVGIATYHADGRLLVVDFPSEGTDEDRETRQEIDQAFNAAPHVNLELRGVRVVRAKDNASVVCLADLQREQRTESGQRLVPQATHAR